MLGGNLGSLLYGDVSVMIYLHMYTNNDMTRGDFLSSCVVFSCVVKDDARQKRAWCDHHTLKRLDGRQ